ncbi:Adaptive-response sensory-kinase SasA [Paenibacillus sp. CECT 9249]|uniref:sensor histidine kinase n=1 Tax=Paenibacillus sp. CECT 9249 TaxID=2845385 RepID=UPI001E45FB6E|nr:HAMP domain-containing sensor histidine kinase [Paenibacillus sp. CECT 9249]CAH0118979.1 Adaptive-response sensory-kinase SasA [Paenibacillus sp. CECT 9249]
MIYLTLIFLIFSLLFTYRRLNNQSIRFMYGIIVGWTVSFFCLILYLSKFNYYHNIINSIFNFSPGTWNYLVLTNFNTDLLIRLLNGGVILFHYSLLCFAVSFAGTRKKWNNKAIYPVITVISLAQIVFYDPAVNVWMQNAIGGLPEHAAAWSNSAVNAANNVFQYMKYIYILLTFALMIHDYLTYPKIRFLKNYALYHIYILVFVAVVHSMLFPWAPKNLVRATFLRGFYNYLQPPIGAYPLILSIFPYVVFMALALLAYIIYRYNSIEAYHKNHSMQINKSIDTASLGTRAFTHALKNHLLAVRAETEYLKDKHSGDGETTYSLKLIDDSVGQALDSIDFAARQLGSIELNLQPLSLSAPIGPAMARMRAEHEHIRIFYRSEAESALAYLDEKHMGEVVYNIFTNAAEAAEDKQRLQITVETKRQNGWGTISIADNGPGIPAEQLELIFSPFFTTKSSVTNWGIGLSFCHKIVEGHDGKITAESEPGQGTTFKIYLPLV